MKIVPAKYSGFCFGVEKAVKTVYELIENPELRGKKIVSFGSLIHNDTVINDLRERGVFAVDSLDGLDPSYFVVIRSHGVPPEVYTKLESMGIPYADCTCPCVKRIQKHALDCGRSGRHLLVFGDSIHPEILGITGCTGDFTVFASLEELREHFEQNDICGRYELVSQSTASKKVYSEIKNFLTDIGADIIFHDTICDATAKRKQEAEELAKTVDVMIVVGGVNSSNTVKLLDACRVNIKQDGGRCILIQRFDDLELKNFNKSDIIGITAGASTPPSILREVLDGMSEFADEINKAETTADNVVDNSITAEVINANDEIETKTETVQAAVNQPEPEVAAKLNTESEEVKSPENQSFQDMLDQTFVNLHTGDVVKGRVISVAYGEIVLDLGYKSDGTLSFEEYSDDPDDDPNKLQAGDELTVFVIRVNDGEGNVQVSKKKIDSHKSVSAIEDANKNGTTLKGKVLETTKGGMIAFINGYRAFVPSSQASNRFTSNLEEFVGKTFEFNIIEFDKRKRRVVAGRRELAQAEQNAKKEEAFNKLNVGDVVCGTVNRITDFGAFVDINGVDGLIHVSELSWNRIRKVTDVLSVGDKVEVTVLKLDKEKDKISLSLKDRKPNPWGSVESKYIVGEIVSGKVARTTTFGAFVELEEGVDGLIHISQLADRRVAKTEDVVSVGDVINVKILGVDLQAKRINLSKKEADGNAEEGEDYSAYMAKDAAAADIDEAPAVDELTDAVEAVEAITTVEE